MDNIQLEHGDHRALRDKFPLSILVHDVDAPMNVGSLFRIADALGVERIYLSGTSPIPPNDKINRTSRSTEKYVPFTYEKNPFDVVDNLKSDGYRIIALEITSTSIDIKDLRIKGRERICLVLGSENFGVRQELLNVADCTVHIPMLGKNSSMNVAIACAIAAFEITRQYLS